MAHWWAKGLLFENCSCQLLCPAHLSFRQRCNGERCLGHWAFRFEDGLFEGASLGGLNAFIVCDAPSLMIEGGWSQVICIDERATSAQRRALETIFTGRAGGAWGVLATFVERRLDTLYLPIQFEDAGRRKSMWCDGVFHTEVDAIKGADGANEALLVNVRNQIHGSPHVLATGRTEASGLGIRMATDGTHGLWSRFSWDGV